MAVGGHSEDAPAGVLVTDRRVARAYAEVGSSEHHGHRRLAEVVLVDRQVALGFGLGQDQHDGGPSPGQVTGPDPDGGKLLELVGMARRKQHGMAGLHPQLANRAADMA